MWELWCSTVHFFCGAVIWQRYTSDPLRLVGIVFGAALGAIRDQYRPMCLDLVSFVSSREVFKVRSVVSWWRCLDPQRFGCVVAIVFGCCDVFLQVCGTRTRDRDRR